ncbi:MAG: ABC transporter permease [Anaerolineae bacterium]|nr:ABC transporter permease [Anaerolineae bacterium]
MNRKRVITLAGRVIRQTLRDRRTVALFLIGPLIIVSLTALLLRSEGRPTPLGIVNQDEGATVLLFGQVRLADRIVAVMSQGDALIPVILTADEAEAALRAGQVRGVVTFPPDFSASFAGERRVRLQLTLEGSNPLQAAAVLSALMQTGMRALAGLASGSAGGELPLAVDVTYLYGGPEYDLLDYLAPPYLVLIVFFFVFLLTTVTFLRERSQGTVERLMATPVTRLEIVTGYMLGFLVFALADAALLLGFTVSVIGLHYAGNLLDMLVIESLLVMVAVNLGIFLSTFARNEFQVLQFIPLVILPMVLLSGLLFPVEDLPGLLQPVAYLLPLTHASDALRAIMIRGQGLAEVSAQIVALLLTGITMLALAAVTVRREVA